MLAERVNGIVAPYLEVGQSKSLTTSILYSEQTDSGLLGDGTVATAEKGKIAVDTALNAMEDFIRNYLEKE